MFRAKNKLSYRKLQLKKIRNILLNSILKINWNVFPIYFIVLWFRWTRHGGPLADSRRICMLCGVNRCWCFFLFVYIKDYDPEAIFQNSNRLSELYCLCGCNFSLRKSQQLDPKYGMNLNQKPKKMFWNSVISQIDEDNSTMFTYFCRYFYALYTGKKSKYY